MWGSDSGFEAFSLSAVLFAPEGRPHSGAMWMGLGGRMYQRFEVVTDSVGTESLRVRGTGPPPLWKWMGSRELHHVSEALCAVGVTAQGKGGWYGTAVHDRWSWRQRCGRVATTGTAVPQPPRCSLRCARGGLSARDRWFLSQQGYPVSI